MSKWIKKGDKVVVIAGNERGRTGTVLSRKDEIVLIQGINIRKKHAKRQSKAAATGPIEMEMGIHISNVSLCDDQGKPIRVKCRIAKNGAKELFYLKGEKEAVHRQVKSKK